MDVETILSTEVDCRRSRQWIFSMHAIARAKERYLSFAEVESALRNGTKSPADDGAWQYKFAGVIAIVDATETTVLTVYPEPGYGIDLDKVKVTESMLRLHRSNCRKLAGDKASWTSHTVAVIDQSGSMRATDIDKDITRSDLVWLTLANDIVYNGLKSGERTSTDVLSVVSMKDEATIIIDRQPIDWVLYNRLVEIMNSEKPSLGGKYIPALDLAETLLTLNRSRNCALTLLFLSDGKPSDHLERKVKLCSDITNNGYESWLARMKIQTSRRIEELASLFGRRLNMCFYAIGPSESSDFSVMKHLAETAEEYECPVIYQPATLNANVLSTALRTMSTTTTDTMTTMSEVPKGHEYREIVKMKKPDVGSPVLTDTWEVFIQNSSDGRIKRIVKSHWSKRGGWANDRYEFSDPSAIGLAWETRWFGEGKERLAKELREVGPDGQSFVGPPMVLKASITVSKTVEVDSKEFCKRFCKSQLKAQEFAKLFNETVSKFPVTIPRIEFLPCWVYMIEATPGVRKGYLVEPSLDVLEYRKFNDNAGNIYKTPPKPSIGHVAAKGKPIAPLGTLYEEDEDYNSEEEDEEEEHVEDEDKHAAQNETAFPESLLAEELEASDVLQSFSCFTYKIASGRSYLVCDLQGTFDKTQSVYRLTDPVIHTSEMAQEKIRLKYGRPDAGERFGRTDRGQAGIDDFFRTHKCTKLCRMLGGRRIRGAEDGTPAAESFLPTTCREEESRYPVGVAAATGTQPNVGNAFSWEEEYRRQHVGRGRGRLHPGRLHPGRRPLANDRWLSTTT